MVTHSSPTLNRFIYDTNIRTGTNTCLVPGRSQELEELQREAEQGGQTVRGLELALKKCREELERQANQLMTSDHEKRERISGLELELKLSRQDLHQIMETANTRNKELQVRLIGHS